MGSVVVLYTSQKLCPVFVAKIFFKQVAAADRTLTLKNTYRQFKCLSRLPVINFDEKLSNLHLKKNLKLKVKIGKFYFCKIL